MNIVVLDRLHFQKPHEQFPWELLEKLGDVTYFDYTDDREVTDRAKDADIILTLKNAISAQIMQTLNCKLLVKIGTGVDRFDLVAAKQQGITVTNFPGYGSELVAQWTMMLLLSLASQYLPYQQAAKSGQWLNAQFSYPIYELAGKTLGLIGYGEIGKRVAAMAHAFNMQILVATRYPDTSTHVRFVDQQTLLRESDFVSLHGNLTPNTQGLISSSELNAMKRTAYLLNTARAGLVDKDALLDALTNHTIAGAAFDGYWQEPPNTQDALLALDNFTVTLTVFVTV